MGPPVNKKQRTASYQTCPPLIRGKPASRSSPVAAHQDGDSLAASSYAQIAAIASAWDIVNPPKKPKRLITETALMLGSDPTKRSYLNIAQNAIRHWREQGSIPAKALDHMEEHYSLVWPSIPFVSRLIRERRQNPEPSAASSSSLSPEAGTDDVMMAGSSNESSTVTTDNGIVFPADVFDEENGLWVDVQYDGEDLAIDSDDEETNVAALLDRATLEFLKGTNRRKVQISWERLMKHWLTHAKVSLEYIDKLMRWIKRHNAVLTEDQIKKLPITGRTFLKITDAEKKSVYAIKARDQSGNQVGTYMHYGLMNAIVGKSPGNLKKFYFQQ